MRFRSAAEHAQCAGSTRSGQKRPYPDRDGPLAAARRLGSLLKMECAFAHLPLESRSRPRWSVKLRFSASRHAAPAWMGRARAALARCSGRAGPPRVVYTLTLTEARCMRASWPTSRPDHRPQSGLARGARPPLTWLRSASRFE